MKKINNLKKNNFPLYSGNKTLIDFAEELIDSGKLDSVSVSKLNSVLELYRKQNNKNLESFIERVSPSIKTIIKKKYNQYLSGQFIQMNPGIKAVQLKDLKPKFRKELDNAVQNSLSMIKTQNEQTMLKLEQRFRNWATIPSKDLRGSLTDKKSMLSFFNKEIINDVDNRYKTKKHLKFILRDQSRKLTGAMDRIAAEEIGAVGFIWQTREDNRVVGKPGGLYPESNNPKIHGDHYDRQGKFYLYRDSWATKNGYVVPRDNVIYADKLTDGMPSVPIGCRCLAENIYHLEDIPSKYKGIITKKGQEFINRI